MIRSVCTHQDFLRRGGLSLRTVQRSENIEDMLKMQDTIEKSHTYCSIKTAFFFNFKIFASENTG